MITITSHQLMCSIVIIAVSFASETERERERERERGGDRAMNHIVIHFIIDWLVIELKCFACTSFCQWRYNYIYVYIQWNLSNNDTSIIRTLSGVPKVALVYKTTDTSIIRTIQNASFANIIIIWTILSVKYTCVIVL